MTVQFYATDTQKGSAFAAAASLPSSAAFPDTHELWRAETDREMPDAAHFDWFSQEEECA
jgi:hypothetical protein